MSLNSMEKCTYKPRESPWVTSWPPHTVAYSWENWKKRLIQLDNDRIKIWVRYIDDIFVIWKGDQASFETFLSRCNDVHPTMKFTGECSPNEIHFLDTTVYKGTRFRNEQILDMKTHIKPTNKQTFVHSTSFHPKGVGKSIVLGETYRYLRTNTNQDTFDKQTRDLEQSLLKRVQENNDQTSNQKHTFQRQTQNYLQTKKQTQPSDHAYPGTYVQYTHTKGP